jgi:hypothetical protein
MKWCVSSCLLLTVCVRLATAQSPLQLPAAGNPPVKLAIISESPAAATAADLLTAELTKNDQVQLLERAEIERVYHEQGLSAANRDYMKLGQILGADGLLLINVTNPPVPAAMSMFAPPPKTVTARMIAVKPGVVLMDASVSVLESS